MPNEELMIVRLTKQSGPLNPNDIAGLPVAKARHLITEGAAIEMIVGVDVDADGQPIRDFADDAALVAADEDDEPASGGSSSSSSNAWKFDKTTDPFVTDGISQEASKALHAIGLHTVDAVRAFIASTPEGQTAADRVNSIDGVSDKQAEKIVSLYGVTE